MLYLQECRYRIYLEFNEIHRKEDNMAIHSLFGDRSVFKVLLVDDVFCIIQSRFALKKQIYNAARVKCLSSWEKMPMERFFFKC